MAGRPPRRAVVSGASRGIGRALSVALSGPGATLALIGRDEAALDETASLCRAQGAETELVPLDVRDEARLRERLLDLDRRGPVDLVVANAGVALPAGDLSASEAATRDEIAVNLLGALNTALPLLPAMAARGRGQVAVVSSLAAFVPLPDSPGYSASKAALAVYGLALREKLRPAGVRVNVICPGYVETDMGSRYRGWRPLLIEAGRAAEHILDGLDRDRPVIAFPRSLALLAKLSTFVPEGVRRLGLSGFRFSIDRH